MKYSPSVLAVIVTVAFAATQLDQRTAVYNLRIYAAVAELCQRLGIQILHLPSIIIKTPASNWINSSRHPGSTSARRRHFQQKVG